MSSPALNGMTELRPHGEGKGRRIPLSAVVKILPNLAGAVLVMALASFLVKEVADAVCNVVVEPREQGSAC